MKKLKDRRDFCFPHLYLVGGRKNGEMENSYIGLRRKWEDIKYVLSKFTPMP